MNNYPHKHIIIALLLVGVLAFVCGGIVRNYTQNGGPAWLDGVVGMILGLTAVLFASAGGLSVYDSWRLGDRGRLYNAVGFVFELIGIIIGLFVFVSGLLRVVDLLR
jgi:hypothetical protein